MKLEIAFLTEIIKRFRYYKILGSKSFEQLSEADIHFTPNEESNSIAVIVQHMHGNMMSRFTDFLTTDGEKSWRQRDKEFESQSITIETLVHLWNQGWTTVFSALEALRPEDLTKEVTIRSEKLLVFDAILRQLAHYPYHIGQIIYIAKIIRNKEWKTLSIPRGESKQFEQQVRQGNHDGTHTGKM